MAMQSGWSGSRIGKEIRFSVVGASNNTDGNGNTALRVDAIQNATNPVSPASAYDVMFAFNPSTQVTTNTTALGLVVIEADTLSQGYVHDRVSYQGVDKTSATAVAAINGADNVVSAALPMAWLADVAAPPNEPRLTVPPVLVLAASVVTVISAKVPSPMSTRRFSTTLPLRPGRRSGVVISAMRHSLRAIRRGSGLLLAGW